MLKFALCPAARLAPPLKPPSVKPTPVMATFETETVDPPVFVIVPLIVWVLPTVTFPNPILARLEPSMPREF